MIRAPVIVPVPVQDRPLRMIQAPFPALRLRTIVVVEVAVVLIKQKGTSSPFFT